MSQEEYSEESVNDLFGERQARWYQIAVLHSVEQALRSGFKRILVEMPTGTGKTLTSGLIFSSDEVRRILGVESGTNIRLLFIAHKHRLLSQAEQVYADASGVDIIFQSAFSDIPAEVLADGWDITCIDEAHHEAMMSIQYKLDKLGDKPIIGLTATPDRADGSLIKFDKIIAPLSRQQAVDEGFLAETSLYSFVDSPTKDKVRILTDMFEVYGNQMGQTMVFVKTRKEVEKLTTVLIGMGYNAVGILSQTEKQLNQVLDDFSNGEIEFIVNCNKINEGVDVKNCQSVVLGRQFGSYPQLNQVIGRASRPDSECRVWELINPLSGRNLDTTVVVGEPISHTLHHRFNGKWIELEFDYTSTRDALYDGKQRVFGE